MSITKGLHEFHQMCDETKAWINEKDQALSTDDVGRDLAGVQMLQRRHQVLFYNLCVIIYTCKYMYILYTKVSEFIKLSAKGAKFDKNHTIYNERVHNIVVAKQIFAYVYIETVYTIS